MANYKIEEKLFLSKAIISNVHGKLLKSRFSEGERNEELVDDAIELATLMLEKRNLLFGESVKSQSVKKHTPEIDFEEILEIFNQCCSELPQVTKLTNERRKLILKILETHTTQDIGTVFNKVALSDYLCGRKQGSDWKASFDWIFNPKNFIKILEGNYDNKEVVEPIKEQQYGRMTESTVQKNFTTFLNSVPDGK